MVEQVKNPYSPLHIGKITLGIEADGSKVNSTLFK